MLLHDGLNSKVLAGSRVWYTWSSVEGRYMGGSQVSNQEGPGATQKSWQQENGYSSDPMRYDEGWYQRDKVAKEKVMVNRGEIYWRNREVLVAYWMQRMIKREHSRILPRLSLLRSELLLIFLYSPFLSLTLPRNHWITHYMCSGNCWMSWNPRYFKYTVVVVF